MSDGATGGPAVLVSNAAALQSHYTLTQGTITLARKRDLQSHQLHVTGASSTCNSYKQRMFVDVVVAATECQLGRGCNLPREGTCEHAANTPSIHVHNIYKWHVYYIVLPVISTSGTSCAVIRKDTHTSRECAYCSIEHLCACCLWAFMIIFVSDPSSLSLPTHPIQFNG